jgi:hypothetical protein
MLCMLPWLSYSQNQERLIDTMLRYDSNNSLSYLLDHGASFDIRDNYGRTPIFYLNHPEDNLKKLLEIYSIDLTIIDNDGYTVYEYLLKENHFLDLYSKEIANNVVDFMNFMDQQHAPYDGNKILFTKKSLGKYDKWKNKYIGKNIFQIKKMVEQYRKYKFSLSNLDNLLVSSNTVYGIYFIIIIIIIFVLLVSLFVVIAVFLWLIFSGRWFRLLKRNIRDIKEYTDPDRNSID